MKSWLKIALQTVKVFILFTGCTILFYYGIMWLNEEYQDYHRYEEPKGAAVKVIAYGNISESSSWFERLILFFLNGE
ncbi:YqzK family protein [Bacillus sp. Bva_UNVM-123]|uniref:YqzK family protein n=1 Tax=Bacillus sp. Bva_UNVM-123 TaxID=2829798 RepID=UPI00391FC530